MTVQKKRKGKSFKERKGNGSELRNPSKASAKWRGETPAWEDNADSGSPKLTKEVLGFM